MTVLLVLIAGLQAATVVCLVLILAEHRIARPVRGALLGLAMTEAVKPAPEPPPIVVKVAAMHGPAGPIG